METGIKGIYKACLRLQGAQKLRMTAYVYIYIYIYIHIYRYLVIVKGYTAPRAWGLWFNAWGSGLRDFSGLGSLGLQ